jgi:RNA polymerase sigma-70 factor (ECF subfamily)
MQDVAADDDDRALVRQAQQGDADAFTKLVLSHQDRIYRLAWRLVGADAAEDLAQHAFLQAWLALDRFHGEARFGTWLYRLAMNACFDELRRTRRFRPLPLRDVETTLAASEDVAEAVVEEAEQEARRHALEWAMERLPSEDRLLLHLRVSEDLGYDAIAELLAVKSTTVGTRLYRVRARLHALVVRRLAEGMHGVR